METSIATVAVSGSLRKKPEAIAAAGWDGVEISEQEFSADEGSPRDLGNMILDHGLEITLFRPFRDLEGLPKGPMRARVFDRAKRKVDLMEELGTDLALFCSFCHPEALGWGRHVNDQRDAWEIERRADHPNIGLVLDRVQTLARGIDPERIRRIPGEGDLDVPGFTRAAMASGCDDHSAWQSSTTCSAAACRAAWHGTPTAPSWRCWTTCAGPPSRRPMWTCLPFRPGSRWRGACLVEFASRGAETQALGALPGTLGRCQGRRAHRQEAGGSGSSVTSAC